MKILPQKKDIDRAKSLEKKMEVDAGLELAKRIDVLRETIAKEEKNLIDYKVITIKQVQSEIDSFITERERLEKEVYEARKERDKLLKPLTAEWALVDDIKAQLAEEKQGVWEEKELLDNEKQEIEIEKEQIAEIIIKTKKNEEETAKAKSETISFKEMAQREYEMAHDEHNKSSKIEEEAMAKAIQLQKEYEVGVTTNQIKENQLKEIESELIIREKDLIRQQNNLKRTYEAIKK